MSPVYKHGKKRCKKAFFMIYGTISKKITKFLKFLGIYFPINEKSNTLYVKVNLLSGGTYPRVSKSLRFLD